MASGDSAISDFGEVVTKRFDTGAGEPEELLRGPFEQLLKRFADLSKLVEVTLAGEHHLQGMRPDYAVHPPIYGPPANRTVAGCISIDVVDEVQAAEALDAATSARGKDIRNAVAVANSVL